jgi:ketopantoate reductase
MGVFEALQMAEETGKPIDQEEVSRSIQAILAADSKDRASMLSDLVHRITCG